MNEIRVRYIVANQNPSAQEMYELLQEYIYERKRVRLDNPVVFNPNNPFDVDKLSRMFWRAKCYFKEKLKIEEPKTPEFFSILSRDGQLIYRKEIKS